MAKRPFRSQPGMSLVSVPDHHDEPFVARTTAHRGGSDRRHGPIDLGVARAVAGFTTTALTDWFARRSTADAEVYDDRLGAFRARVNLGYVHM